MRSVAWLNFLLWGRKGVESRVQQPAGKSTYKKRHVLLYIKYKKENYTPAVISIEDFVERIPGVKGYQLPRGIVCFFTGCAVRWTQATRRSEQDGWVRIEAAAPSRRRQQSQQQQWCGLSDTPCANISYRGYMGGGRHREKPRSWL